MIFSLGEVVLKRAQQGGIVVRSVGLRSSSSMATMIAELYDALVKAGADDASAGGAAIAVPDYDQRLADVGRPPAWNSPRLLLTVASLDGSDSDSSGFAAIKSALRTFERWLTFCCIVMLLVQLATILLILRI